MDIYAHRGSSGTHPENTLSAFKHAANLPIQGVEFDVHLTKDCETLPSFTMRKLIELLMAKDL